MKQITHSLPLALVCLASLFFVWTLVRPVSAAKANPSVLQSAQPQMSSTHYALDWSTAGGISGGDTASTHYKLSATIGEMAAGSSASTNYASCSGFQCVFNFLHVYLPLIFR
jgi:hypothetical protein